MKIKFEKQEFLRQIHTIPSWVKNGDDLLKFCKHLNYRLLQEKAINSWYHANFGALSLQKFEEVSQIQFDYDDAYNNDVSKFQPFSEIFS